MSDPVEGTRITRPMCAQPLRGVPPLKADLPQGRAYSIRRVQTKWMNGTVLHFCFLTGRDWTWPEGQRKVVRNAFQAWSALGIGLQFKEVEDETEAEILIGRRQDNRSWSFVGTENLGNRDDGRTMNFGWDLETDWGRATALHEIGHALGLEHEHQNPLAGIVWDEPAVYAHFKRTDGWDADETYHNVISKLSTNSVDGSNWDPTSIMHYPFDPGLMKLPQPYDRLGVGENTVLSDADKAWVRHWYPAQAAAMPISALSISPLPMVPGAQADFVFNPDSTREYTVGTVGKADSRIVVFEERDGEPRHLAAADDTGTDENAEISGKFVAGRTYLIRVRVAHANGDRPIGLVLR